MQSALEELRVGWRDEHAAVAKYHADKEAVENARYLAETSGLDRHLHAAEAVLTLAGDRLPSAAPNVKWAFGGLSLEWTLGDKVVSLFFAQRKKDRIVQTRIIVQTCRSESHPDAEFDFNRQWCDDNTVFLEYFECSVDNEESTRKACAKASAALVAQFE